VAALCWSVSTTCANSAQCSDHSAQCSEAARTLVQVFISSRLDYCNSLLYGLPHSLIHRVQSVQNAAARLLTGTRRGTTSRQFCVSCIGFLSRDVLTSNWHVSFTRLCPARHLRTWLMTYTCFQRLQDVGFARPPTDRALFHAHTTQATEALLLLGHVFETASQ